MDTTQKQHYLALQPGESVVANMAATIFAALIRNKGLTEQNEENFLNQAVQLAIKLAEKTEQFVKSDEEWTRSKNG